MVGAEPGLPVNSLVVQNAFSAAETMAARPAELSDAQSWVNLGMVLIPYLVEWLEVAYAEEVGSTDEAAR